MSFSFFMCCIFSVFFFFQAEDGIRALYVTGVETCALPICRAPGRRGPPRWRAAGWWRPSRGGRRRWSDGPWSRGAELERQSKREVESSYPFGDGGRHVAGLRGAPDIGCPDAGGQSLLYRSFEVARGLGVAELLQHQRSGQHGGDRVRHAL